MIINFKIKKLIKMFNSKVITIQSNDKIKEGWLQKESRYRKVWRDRWCVLTSEFFYTFANEKQYIDPTEQIEISKIKTVKTDEERKGNFLVSIVY